MDHEGTLYRRLFDDVEPKFVKQRQNNVVDRNNFKLKFSTLLKRPNSPLLMRHVAVMSDIK